MNLKGKKIHFLGVGGVGVNALARYALDRGAVVSGSDKKLNGLCKTLSALGASITQGDGEDGVDGVDIVVYTSALPLEHPALARAREHNIMCVERHDFLGQIARDYKTVIGVAGTHGKTTTTAMLTHILFSCGKKFVSMIGGESVDFSNYVNNTLAGEQDENAIFLTEACEYRRNFLSLNPTISVITNVECDHPDSYADIAAVKEAFELFEREAVVKIRQAQGENFCARCEKDSGASTYIVQCGSLYKNGEFVGQLNADSGDYNLKNAAFAVIAAGTVGIDERAAIKALSSFAGVKRRFEFACKIKGIPAYFDFAHHPTEIACVLKRASEKGKILAVFQPHTFSRTKAYFADFVDVLGGCENVKNLLIMPTYAAREIYDETCDSKVLFNAICENFPLKNVSLAKGVSDVISYVLEHANENDIIMFIGAGDIYDIKDMLSDFSN